MESKITMEQKVKKKSWQQRMKDEIAELKADLNAVVMEPLSERALRVQIRIQHIHSMDKSVWYGTTAPEKQNDGLLNQLQ